MKIKERSKGISFVFVTHNKEKEVFDYVNELNKLTNDNVNFIVIFDSEFTVNEKFNTKNVKFYSNKGNIGKLNSLIKWKDFFPKKFIKIIDNDDCVNYFDAIKLSELSLNFNEKFFYLHKACKVYSDNVNYGKITTNKKEINKIIKQSTDVNWKIPPNAKSIYSTFILDILAKINLKKQNYYNDDLLSVINILNTIDNVEIDIKPYIQYHSLGQTSLKSKKRYKEQLVLHQNLCNIAMNGPLIIRDKYNFNLDTFRKRLAAQKINNNIQRSSKIDGKIIKQAELFLKIIKVKFSNIPQTAIEVNKGSEDNSSKLNYKNKEIVVIYPDQTSNYGLKEISNQNEIYDLTFFREDKKIDNFIDVGCNIGLSTIWAKLMFGDELNVASYEPSKELKKYYLKNTNSFTKVNFDNSALSFEEGEGIFYYSNSHNGSSTTSKKMVSKGHDKSYKVKIKSITSEIESFLALNKKGKTILKIDIEGAEDDFIETPEFLKLLKKIDYFLFELHGDIEKQLRQIKAVTSVLPEENIAFDMQYNFPERIEGIINYRKIFGREIDWKKIDTRISAFKKASK